jgi:cytidylate kinase
MIGVMVMSGRDPSSKRLAGIEAYLGAHAAEMRIGEDGGDSRVRPFITISRQAGAGGHRLAETLLEVFAQQDDVDLFGGWQVFDRRLCEIVAENPTHSRSMSSLLAEEYRTKTDEFLRQMLGSSIDQDMLMLHVFRVVSAVASIGKAIIVGRAGSEVTREMDQGLALRLIAPEDVRIQRVMAYYDVGEKAARVEARKLDTSRARLLKSHFRVDIDDPARYDAVWNTGRVSVELIAESVVAALRHMALSSDVMRAR